MEHDEKINSAFTDISNLKIQLLRIFSDLDSEKGSLKRQEERLTEQINKVEKEFRDIIYDAEKGLLIKIDRLTQESISRQNVKKNIVALWIAVVISFIKIILDVIFKK